MTSTPNPILEVEDVWHSYNGRYFVLKGVRFSVDEGQVVCLLGPSGCGKSTLLKIIAGLLSPVRGRIRIHGQDQRQVPTHRRDVGFVFQNGALFPHLNVSDNISFAFRYGRKQPKGSTAENAVADILDRTGLHSHRNYGVANLSGGQAQRVALARALVYRPSLLLLDEPLSSLDNDLKSQLMDLMLRLHDQLQSTFVYVTHDEREALRIATHVIVFDGSHKLRQYGPTREVVEKPASVEAAKLVNGWSFLKGAVDPQTTGSIRICAGVNIQVLLPRLQGDSSVIVGVPIERIAIRQDDPLDPGAVAIPVRILRTQPSFDRTFCECDIEGAAVSDAPILTGMLGGGTPTPGDKAFAIISREAIHEFSD